MSIIWLAGLLLWFCLMGSIYGAEGIWFPALFMVYGIALQWLGSDTIGQIVGGSVIVFWAGYISLQLGRFAWRKLHWSWFPTAAPLAPPSVDR